MLFYGSVAEGLAYLGAVGDETWPDDGIGRHAAAPERGEDEPDGAEP